VERDGEVGGDCRYPVSRFYARLGLSGDTERLSRANGGQTGWCGGEREAERSGGEGSDGPFRWKASEVLGGDEEDVDSTRVKYRLDALPTSAFPAGYALHTDSPQILFISQTIPFLFFLCLHSSSSLLLSTETVPRPERDPWRLVAPPRHGPYPYSSIES